MLGTGGMVFKIPQATFISGKVLLPFKFCHLGARLGTKKIFNLTRKKEKVSAERKSTRKSNGRVAKSIYYVKHIR
jgi:hypothetical protein